jgi:hypothetical protein
MPGSVAMLIALSSGEKFLGFRFEIGYKKDTPTYFETISAELKALIERVTFAAFAEVIASSKNNSAAGIELQYSP